MAPRKPKAPQQDDGQELYIRWAHAWIICRDGLAAARAIGIPETQVSDFLKMAEYSAEAQRIISEDIVYTPDFKSPDALRDAVMKQLWREARNSTAVSGASARVAALRAIADIGGIENPEEGKALANSGGMLFVPVMKMDQWEKACEKHQAALKAEVHD